MPRKILTDCNGGGRAGAMFHGTMRCRICSKQFPEGDKVPWHKRTDHVAMLAAEDDVKETRQ